MTTNGYELGFIVRRSFDGADFFGELNVGDVWTNGRMGEWANGRMFCDWVRYIN